MSMAAASLARDIAQRYHHRAALICPANSNVIQDLIDIGSIDFSQQRENFAHRRGEILSAYGFSDSVPNEKPFAYQDGVAIIPIHGMLINRFSGSYSFVTGYNFIRSQMISALADGDVKLIVYDINSPGGIASGCSELSQEIFDSRSQKPSLAVIDSRCYSAAYFLGSSATRMVATPSGGLGSIGTVAMHVDYSGALEQQGIAVTYISFPEGGQKTDGNPYEALSARAKASIQRDVDYHGGLFVDAVARNRDISEDDVRATQAACFLPPEALELGLIDDVATPADAISQFYNDNLCDDEDGTMSQGQTGAAASKWGVGASRSLSVSDNSAWDGPAAAKRMLDAAGFNGNSPNVAQARAGFLVYDAGNPSLRGSYKLPFADIVNGNKVAVAGGLRAAASRLPQTDIPAAVKTDAKAVLDSYEAKLQKQRGGKSKSSTEGINEMDDAEINALIDQRVAAGIASATATERTRQSGIRTCEEAKGREFLAAYFADQTEMTVDQAKAALAAAPKAEATKPGDGAGGTFTGAMDRTQNPNVGADGNGDGVAAGAEKDTPAARASTLLGDYVAATGAKVIELKATRAA